MNYSAAGYLACAWFVAILAVKSDHPVAVLVLAMASASVLLGALLKLVRKEGQ